MLTKKSIMVKYKKVGQLQAYCDHLVTLQAKSQSNADRAAQATMSSRQPKKPSLVPASHTLILQGLKSHVDEDGVEEFISDAGINKFMNAKV